MGRGLDFFEEGGGFEAGLGQRLNGKRQQRFALKKGETIAIERGVDLQGVAAVLYHVGIHETRNDALADQGFGQTAGKFTSQVSDILRLATHEWRPC